MCFANVVIVRRYKPLKDEIRISLIAEDRDTDFQ